MDPQPPDPQPRRSVLRSIPQLIWRTIVKCYDDSIFGQSAGAAFYQTLSLPPLLLGLLGSIGYVGDAWFGAGTVATLHEKIISFCNRTFSPNVVNEIIAPTVNNVLQQGRGELISAGFVLSLWAGSSAMSSFVAAIVCAHQQEQYRNPVWQRIFALGLYLGSLIIGVIALPLVALGPNYLKQILPDAWRPFGEQIIDVGYFPTVLLLLVGALSALYRVALPRPLPWHRLVGGALLAGVVFWVAAALLRIYLTNVTKTGYSYGALATPIAYLLFTFFLGFAIIVGAEFNAAVQEFWPTKHLGQMRQWMGQQTGQLKTIPIKLASGPIRRATTPRDRDRNSPSHRDQD